ncbi:hypothetical protein [Bradyrhizobium diazoefficiens]
MPAYNKQRRERDFEEGMAERKQAAEDARRAGWVSHDDDGLAVWTHPDRPGVKHYGHAINIPEQDRH